MFTVPTIGTANDDNFNSGSADTESKIKHYVNKYLSKTNLLLVTQYFIHNDFKLKSSWVKIFRLVLLVYLNVTTV